MTTDAERQSRYYYRHQEDCKQQLRDYYKNHREEILKHHQKTHDELRMKCLIHYGGDPPKCACCGEDHLLFLTIDHIFGGGNHHKKEIGGSGRLYNWLVQNNFPEGFQVLCYNCNCAKYRGHSSNGFCPIHHP